MELLNSINLKRWIPSLIILPIAVYFVLNRGHYTLIDNADLVIHEAGHAVFSIFGRFIYTLGGTLMQIILPSIIVWYFLINRYLTGTQFGLLWLGQNLVNISVYAADARARILPLLGGNKVYHDWNWILSKTGLLEYDSEVGIIFFSLAIIIFLITIFLPLIIKD
jgi:Zn-dependent membrane protease YugP